MVLVYNGLSKYGVEKRVANHMGVWGYPTWCAPRIFAAYLPTGIGIQARLIAILELAFFLMAQPLVLVARCVFFVPKQD